MKLVLRLALAFTFCAFVAAGAPVTGQPARLAAPDGTKLAATYYPASRPGPGILLLHQCNRDRSSWNALAAELAAKGFHVLTLDYRGYGESGGTPYTTSRSGAGPDHDGEVARRRRRRLRVPAGAAGRAADAFGAGGASCGVNNSIQLSLRHPEVKSLVLLSGNTDRKGRQHLKRASALPLLFAAADDDGGVVSVMAWIDATSGNKANRFLEYPRAGTARRCSRRIRSCRARSWRGSSSR